MPVSAQTFGYYRPRFTLAQMRGIIESVDIAEGSCLLDLDDEEAALSARKQLKDMLKEND